MAKEPTAKLWWVLGAVCVAVAAILPFVWLHTGADLKVYRLGGSALLDDPSTIYTARLVHISMPFTYPIFGALVMVPAALLPWPVSYGAAIALSLVALFVIWKLCIGRTHIALLTAVVAASMLLDPVRETISYGQINLILCAIVLYDVLRVGKSRRGILIGLAAGIKLTPLVFFGLLLVTRQWRALFNATAAFVATVAFGFLLAPRTALQYWTEILLDSGRIGALAYSGNQSWNGFLVRFTNNQDGGGPYWLILVALTVAAGLWACRLLWIRGEHLGAVAVCGLISLFCSPVSWSHHWVWIIPLGVALARQFQGRTMYAVAATWFALFALAPIWWPPRGGDQELQWSLLAHLAGDSYLWLSITAVATLLLTTRIPHHSREPVVLIPRS
ncbi:glycosyltransferase 87 family protein [Kribbella deserti]|uniref:Glycosyltransferase 87 family protein n=1 Tax=Kribbella deserti TaxID=1926257 RepID=A0ABV6QI02_9ACTN